MAHQVSANTCSLASFRSASELTRDLSLDLESQDFMGHGDFWQTYWDGMENGIFNMLVRCMNINKQRHGMQWAINGVLNVIYI